MQDARAICSACPGQGISATCAADAPRRRSVAVRGPLGLSVPVQLDPRSICAHRANPRLSISSKAGRLGTRPLGGHRTPIIAEGCCSVEAGARVGVTGWAFARRLGSFIHSSLWRNTRILHLHRDGQLYPPLSRHDPQQHRFLYPPPQIVSHARPVLNCAQPGLARSRLVLAPGPVRVKPLQGPRRAVGSCPFSGRIHCLSGCFK